MTCSAKARPTPRPWAIGLTMKLAVATCAPRPGRFGPHVAEPRTAAAGSSTSSTATTVWLGSDGIQSARPSSSVIGSG